MKKRLEIKDGKLPQKDVKKEVPYEGQPYFLDEYGGIKWVHGKQFAKNSWGYGQGPKTLDEFYARLKDITFTVLDVYKRQGVSQSFVTWRNADNRESAQMKRRTLFLIYLFVCTNLYSSAF